MRSTTETLIAATRELAATIQCDDGVANAVLSEAADRLEELQQAIECAISHAGNHYMEWGERAEKCFEILEGANK